MKAKAKLNPQSARIGAITDDERKLAEMAYVDHREACKRVGCPAETFERYLVEYVEDLRAPTIEGPPAGVYHRNYERMFEGKRGFDIEWVANK